MNISLTRHSIILLVSSWLVLFGVVPLGLIIATSFLAQDTQAFFRLEFSVAAYLDLLHPGYLDTLLRSVKLAAITTLGCLMVGYPFAWYTSRLTGSSKTIVLILLMLPFWTNRLVRT